MKIEHNKLEGVYDRFGVVKLRFDGAKDTYSREFFSTSVTSLGGEINLFLDDETIIAMAEQLTVIAQGIRNEQKEEVSK